MNRTDRVIIEAENLHKTYTIGKTTVPVLSGAAISVGQGEAVSVVGVSGAGKSTLLHVLGGLQRPDEGRVVIDSRDVYSLSGGERTRVRAVEIGFVFQSYHLLPEMDVLENVMLPARALGRRSMTDMRNRAVELLESVGLAERGKHRPMELSGGEQQRVALARALMNDPQVILADEPTGNLDSGTGGQVLDYLLALVRNLGHTLVLVTHNEQIAGRCDRTLHLQDGVLVGG